MNKIKNYSVSSDILIDALNTLKHYRKINYENITNPIQLRRLQNASTQIDIYYETVKEINSNIKQIEKGEIREDKDRPNQIAELLLAEVKMEFEILAIIHSLMENSPDSFNEINSSIFNDISKALETANDEFLKLVDLPNTIKNLFLRTYTEVCEELNKIKNKFSESK